MNAIYLLWVLTIPLEPSALTCDAPFANLGPCRGGPVISHQFRLENQSPETIRIFNLRTGCGCLRSQADPMIVPPGGSTRVSLQVGTISQPDGDNVWSLRVEYRVGDRNAHIDLTLKADLRREVKLEPSAIRLSGSPGLAHTITLVDHRDRPLELVGVEAAHGRVAVDCDEPWKRNGDRWVRRIRVGIKSSTPAGKSDDDVRIISRDPDYRELSVPVSTTRRDKSRVVALPGDLVWNGDSVEQLVLLRDSSGQPVEIEAVESDDSAIVASFTKVAQPTGSVRVSIANGAAPHSRLRIRLKSPVVETIYVPVTVRR